VGETTGNTGAGAIRTGTPNRSAPAKNDRSTTGQERVIAEPLTSSAPGHTARGNTHIVQKDETFSTIAKAVYGKQKYAAEIVKANPTLDPRRLKPGTTIILPDVASVEASSSKPTAAAAKSGTAAGGERSAAKSSEPAVNPSTEYRVQPGDSLYKISVKLYGNGSHAEELYDNNSKLIGDDPAKLKVNTVLKLHDAPRVKQAAR